MAALSVRLQGQDYCRWVKAGLCLTLVKEGLEAFAYDKSKELHEAVLVQLRNSGNPSASSVCSTACVCLNKSSKSWEVICGCSNCNAYLHELYKHRCLTLGRNRNQPFSFRQHNFYNTDIQGWPTDPWQLAKLFMNPGQKISVNNPKDTDLSGILNFIDHCVTARQDIQNTENIAKVRDSRNRIMHSSALTMTQDEFKMLSDAMVELLEDKLVLLGMSDARQASDRIKEVQRSTFHITKMDEGLVLSDETSELQHWNELVQQDVRHIQACLHEVQNNGDEDATSMGDALKKEIMWREQELQNITRIYEHVRRKISEDDGLCKQLEARIRELHAALHETSEELQVAQKEIELLKDRVSNIEERTEAVERVTSLMDERTSDIESHIDELSVRSEELQSQMRLLTSSKYGLGHNDFSKGYKRLQQNMVHEYKRVCQEVSLSPLYEGLQEKFPTSSIDELYTETKVVRLDSNGETELSTWNDIFVDGDKTNRTILVKGETGVGKSTWCLQLLNAWCKSHDQNASRKRTCPSCFCCVCSCCNNSMDTDGFVADDTAMLDIQKAVAQFDFLFFIPLRYVDSQSSLIDIVFSTKLERFSHFSDIFIQIMSEFSHKVLFLLDGLDEFAFSLDFSGLNQSTVIITTRPWKYDAVCSSPTGIKADLVLTLKGLKGNGVQELIEKVIRVSDPTTVSNDAFIVESDKCFNQIKSAGLGDAVKIPLILIFMVQCWIENKKSLSPSFTYNILNLLNLFLLRGDEKLSDGDTAVTYNIKKMKWRSKNSIIPNILDEDMLSELEGLLLQLGMVAFEGLVSHATSVTLVYTEKQLLCYLTPDDLEICFKLGLLSRSKSFTTLLHRKKLYVSFYHKLIQEFFAALYIVSSDKALSQCVKTLTSPQDAIQMDNIMLFMCGLNPTFGARLASHVVDICCQDISIRDFRNAHEQHRPNEYLEKFTLLFLKCQKEIKESRNSDVKLRISDIVLYNTFDDLLPDLVQQSMHHLRSLCLYHISISWSVFTKLCKSIADAVLLQKLEVIVSEVSTTDGEDVWGTGLDISGHDHLKVLTVRASCNNCTRGITVGNNDRLEHVVCIGLRMPTSSWNSFFSSLGFQSIITLKLQLLDIRDSCIDLRNSTRLESLTLDSVQVLEITLGHASKLADLVMYNVTMPRLSWNRFFETVYSGNMRNLALWNINTDKARLVLETITHIDHFEARNVDVSELKFCNNVEVQNVSLYKVSMTQKAWNDLFGSLCSQNMHHLKLAALELDEAVLNLDNVLRLENLQIADVRLSGMKLQPQTDIHNLNLKSVIMPQSSWHNMFKSVRLETIHCLVLSNLHIGECIINLESSSQLTSVRLLDVHVLEVKLGNNKKMEEIEFLRVTMPPMSWKNFCLSLASLNIHRLSLEYLDCDEAIIRLTNSKRLDYLKLMSVKVFDVIFGDNVAPKYIWLKRMTMPNMSWNNFFTALQTERLCSLTISEVNTHDIVINLMNCTTLEALEIRHCSFATIEFAKQAALQELELESVTMPPLSWSQFFERLPSRNVSEMTLKNLEIGKAIINIPSTTKLHRLNVENVAMSKKCYKRILAMQSKVTCIGSVTVNGKLIHR